MNERRWNLLLACVLSTAGLSWPALPWQLLGAGRQCPSRQGFYARRVRSRHAADVPERTALAPASPDQLDRNLGGFSAPVMSA